MNALVLLLLAAPSPAPALEALSVPGLEQPVEGATTWAATTACSRDA